MKKIISIFLAFVLVASFVPAVYAADKAPMSSSFMDGVVDDGWTVIRPETTGDYAYEVIEGMGLKLRTQPSGMQVGGTSNPTNIFTRPANADGFEAVAKVFFPVAPNANYQQLAFGVYDSDNNYVKLDIEFNSGWVGGGGRMAQFSINRNGTYAHDHRTLLSDTVFPAEANATRAENLTAYYKIVKDGDLYTASVSFDGINYVTVGTRGSERNSSNTNGQFNIHYNEPKLFVAAVRDQENGGVIDAYVQSVTVSNVVGGEPEPTGPKVQFNYNYQNAPAAPASFTKTANADGKLSEFPIEQTLPQGGARPDWGFVGWYLNPEGTGEKVTLDTIFTQDTNLYAKWEQVPSLYKAYEDYFLMGAFRDYTTGTNDTATQIEKHYNILCPSNNFKLTNMIGGNQTNSISRQTYNAAVAAINADASLTDEEKAAAIQAANADVRLQANRAVDNTLRNMRTHNQQHPDEPKYTRFHVVSWHGGQQPKYFFTNGFTYTNDETADRLTAEDPTQPGAWASRETMIARLDSYIKALVDAYKEYDDLIVSWDITNEPVDDFTGQIRNGTDSSSQYGNWGEIWHDSDPALNEDGTRKYTKEPDDMGVIYDPERLFDESEWIRMAFESAAKYFDEAGVDWPLYLNDYMDSNKLYTKLEPTLDIIGAIRDNVDLKDQKLVYGLQGRLAYAYPTIDMLRNQVEDALEIADMVGVTEGDIRSDFEPNPYYDPTQPTRPVQQNDTPQWEDRVLESGSGSYPIRSTLMNTFDTHNSPVRRTPEWGTGNGMNRESDRYGADNFLAISEQKMKLQADFAADWMDILIDNADKVELFQWDGTTDSSTFNQQKGAHLWVSGVQGRQGTFEKYSFFAVIGAPERDKLEKAIAAVPGIEDGTEYPDVLYWTDFAAALKTATALVDERIYTLEDVNDVIAARESLLAAADQLAEHNASLIYAVNDDTTERASETYISGATATVKASVGFEREGHTFSGWNTKADGTGIAYKGGEEIVMDNHVTLFAQWDAQLVKFRSEGGTEIEDVYVPTGATIAKPADPTKEGYAFAGWYSDLAMTKLYDFDAPVTEGLRLYAQWTVALPAVVDIQFNFNYNNAPAAPASFQKQTGEDGKLTEFPVEQTLPLQGARSDWAFVGWYLNPEGTGEKVTLDTVFTDDAQVYAKWEQVPSLYKAYEDYFLMGAFNDYSTSNPIHEKHYNVLCPSNSFKLDSQIGNNNTNSASRQAYAAAVAAIEGDASLSDEEKAAAIQAANTDVRLQANRGVVNTLNNMVNHNAAHPEEPKYTRFHVIAWHGGQQPKYFFTNGFTYTNDETADRLTREDPTQPGAWASRETMMARLDSYIKALVEAYKPYEDIIVSWDIVNEPVDDFTGQIRNRTDSSSQRGDWGNIWHDQDPALNADGSLRFTETADDMGVIYDPERLFDESGWMRAAFESAAKYFDEYDVDWPLYLNDYMDSNKLYTKYEPTIDILHSIRDDVDLKDQKLVYGLQGRLAYAYPTIDMLRAQVEDALEIADMVGVTEGDIRSDFEPNPYYDPTQPTRPVRQDDTPQWAADVLESGSGSYPIRSTLMNTFDTHNSPVRRTPEWGTGNGMGAHSDRYGADNYLAISEQKMKLQADFAADWMDILIDNADKVELFQWDGTSDSSTFNSSKGAHLWVSTGGGWGGGAATYYEKYSFFAVIGAPERDKLEKAIAAVPGIEDGTEYPDVLYWTDFAAALKTATALVDERIYTLEDVNDVIAARESLLAAADQLAEYNASLIYAVNDDTTERTSETYKSGATATVKASVGFEREGHRFSGWNTKADGTGIAYTGGEEIVMDNHVTLFAQWDAQLVKFRSEGGTEIAAVHVPTGETVDRPEDPEREGYHFRGWYSDLAMTKLWDFDEPVTEGMRLYARWTKEFLRFKNDDGEKITEAMTIVPEQTLLVEASFESEDDADQTMIVALYDDEKLVDLATAVGENADGWVDFDAALDIPADISADAFVKVFVWDSETYVPVHEAVIFQ